MDSEYQDRDQFASDRLDEGHQDVGEEGPDQDYQEHQGEYHPNFRPLSGSKTNYQTYSRDPELIFTSNLTGRASLLQAPTKKLYMCVGITPSAELTGGPFYDGHNIDVGLISDLSAVALRFVQEKVSFSAGKKKRETPVVRRSLKVVACGVSS